MRPKLVLLKILGVGIVPILFLCVALLYAAPGSDNADMVGTFGGVALMFGIGGLLLHAANKLARESCADRFNMITHDLQSLLLGLGLGLFIGCGGWSSPNGAASFLVCWLTVGLIQEWSKRVRKDPPSNTTELIAMRLVIRTVIGGGLCLASFSLAKIATRQFDLFTSFDGYTNPIVLTSLIGGLALLSMAFWKAPPFVYAHNRPLFDTTKETEWSTRACRHCRLPPPRVLAHTGQCITCGYIDRRVL